MVCLLISYKNISRIRIPLHCYVVLGGDKRRKEELWECTKILGIPEDNVTIIM